MTSACAGNSGVVRVVRRSPCCGVSHVKVRIVLLKIIERTVEEVEGLHADLESLRLTCLDFLEETDLVIDISGPVNVGKTEGPVVVLRGCSKTGRIEVLVRLQPLVRIAGHERAVGLVGSPGDGFATQVETVVTVNSDHLIAAVLIMQHTILRDVGEGRIGTVLLDAGNLPSIKREVGSLVTAEIFLADVGENDVVRNIDGLRTIEWRGVIAVVLVEWVFAVKGQRLPIGIGQPGVEHTLRTGRSYLERVVVRIEIVNVDPDVAIGFIGTRQLSAIGPEVGTSLRSERNDIGGAIAIQVAGGVAHIARFQPNGSR
jgi:hypothetical protein